MITRIGRYNAALLPPNVRHASYNGVNSFNYIVGLTRTLRSTGSKSIIPVHLVECDYLYGTVLLSS
jgi:hypothetical protein